nr:MlaD family protein [Gordonia araii]
MIVSKPLGGNRAGRIRAILVLATVVVVAVGAAVGAPRLLQANQTRQICADFTDAIGVYEGNSVALMGLPVGHVADISPRDGGVRITLDVDRDLVLPADTGAVVIDSSIVADRRVEFSKPYGGGPRLEGSGCIPQARTKTPRGVSRAFEAVDTLLGDLLGSDSTPAGRGQTDRIAQLVQTLDRNVAGRESEIKNMMRNAVVLSGTPSETDDIIRRLIDNSDTLSRETLGHWPDVSKVVRTMNDSVLAFIGWAEEFSGTLESAVRFVPTLADFMRRVGDRMLSIVELIQPWVRFLAPFVQTIAQLIAQLPGLASVTDLLFDRQTGALRVSWTPPTVAVRPAEAAGLCAVLGRPSGCAPAQAQRFGLIRMILRGQS